MRGTDAGRTCVLLSVAICDAADGPDLKDVEHYEDRRCETPY
jgi:hypothetical protein